MQRSLLNLSQTVVSLRIISFRRVNVKESILVNTKALSYICNLHIRSCSVEGSSGSVSNGFPRQFRIRRFTGREGRNVKVLLTHDNSRNSRGRVGREVNGLRQQLMYCIVEGSWGREVNRFVKQRRVRKEEGSGGKEVN